MGNTITKKYTALLVLSSVVFSGCIAYGNKEKVSLTTETKSQTLNANLAALDVSNNTVSIHGTGLSGVTSLRIKGNGIDKTLTINSQSDTQIIAVAGSAFALAVGKTFDLILSSASASTTFPITFTLDSMGANSGQVLKFDGTSWAPADLASSQTYLGTWDADNRTPALEASPNAGDYYIITVAGDYPNPGDTYDVGDWIIYNGTAWEKVSSGLNGKLSLTGGRLTGDLKLDTLLMLKGGSNYVTLKASSSLASDIALTLPTTVGTSGQVLTTNGSGVLSWTTPATSAAPSGSAGGDLSGSYPNPTITGLSAAKIADGSVSNAKFQYLSGVTSDIQTQLNAKQAGGNFITALTGDVIAAGPGSTAASVASVGGVSASDIAAAATIANAATNANTNGAAVKRDSSGNFSAGTITATLNGTATNVSGVVAVANGGTGNTSLTLNQLLFGNGTSAINGLAITTTPSILLSTNVTGAPSWVTSTTGNYLKATTGVGVSFGAIAASDLPTAIDTAKLANGTVTNTKFQYLSGVTSDIQTQLDSKQSSGSFMTALTGDVTASGPGSSSSTVAAVGGVTATNVAAGANLANAAVNTNTASTIVKRDASGNFSAGTITATLNGNATNVSGTVAVGNGGTGATSFTANGIVIGNGTSALSNISVSTTPAVLLSAVTTGLPTWTTSTTGNYLKAVTGSGVTFGTISSSDLPSGTLSGSGTAGKIPYYNAASTLADSPLAVSSSSIGIGTTSPSTTLHVVGTTSTSLLVENTASNISGIEFKNSASTGSAEAIVSSNDTINIQTGGTNRVYIGSNFGVGAAAPSGVPFYVKSSSLEARFDNTSSGSSALANTMNGVEFVTGSMNTTNKYGQGIKFMSTDTDFVTEPVKFLAGIYPRATEGYTADTRGGTALDFLITANNPGATNLPTTAMTIDQSGYVGIGVTAPTAKLDVNGGIVATTITSPSITGTTVSAANLYSATATVSSSAPSAYTNIVQNTSTSGFSATAYNDSSGTAQTVVGYSNASAPLFADTSFLAAYGGKPLAFGIGSAEVARFNTSGQLGLGTSTITQRLTVNGNILASGTVTGSSDRRLKKDIRPIEDALSALDKITGVKYFWINPKEHNEGEQIGVIAQDVEKVFPQAVITGSDGYKSVSYMALVSPVIQAIKELNVKLKALVTKVVGIDSRVEKLEKENAELKARLQKIENALLKK